MYVNRILNFLHEKHKGNRSKDAFYLSYLVLVLHIFQLVFQIRECWSCIRVILPTSQHYLIPTIKISCFVIVFMNIECVGCRTHTKHGPVSMDHPMYPVHGPPHGPGPWTTPNSQKGIAPFNMKIYRRSGYEKHRLVFFHQYTLITNLFS